MRVKIFYIDMELEEIELPDSYSAFDVSCYIIRKCPYDMSTMTHFKILHKGKWLYGNEYTKAMKDQNPTIVK